MSHSFSLLERISPRWSVEGWGYTRERIHVLVVCTFFIFKVVLQHHCSPDPPSKSEDSTCYRHVLPLSLLRHGLPSKFVSHHIPLFLTFAMLIVYYESIKRNLKIKCIYEYWCDDRLQTKINFILQKTNKKSMIGSSTSSVLCHLSSCEDSQNYPEAGNESDGWSRIITSSEHPDQWSQTVLWVHPKNKGTCGQAFCFRKPLEVILQSFRMCQSQSRHGRKHSRALFESAGPRHIHLSRPAQAQRFCNNLSNTFATAASVRSLQAPQTRPLSTTKPHLLARYPMIESRTTQSPVCTPLKHRGIRGSIC